MARLSFLVAVLVASSTAGGAATATPPTLRIRAVAPLTVAGSGFVVRERVTLTVLVAARLVARQAVTAGSRGTFHVRFSTLVAVAPCRGSVVVEAAGASGNRASVRRPCRPPHRGGPVLVPGKPGLRHALRLRRLNRPGSPDFRNASSDVTSHSVQRPRRRAL